MCRIFWRFVFCLAIGIVGSSGLSLANQPCQASIQKAHRTFALDTVCFFDWLEAHFPEHLYAPAQSTANGWTYRHYAGAEAYLAVYTGPDGAYRNQVFSLGVMGEDTFSTIWMADRGGGNARDPFHVGPEAAPYHGRKMGSYLFTVPQWYAVSICGGAPS